MRQARGSDDNIPRVIDELDALTGLFEDSETLVGALATREALRVGTQQADVVHLACHGQFRPDNPLFSALWLGEISRCPAWVGPWSTPFWAFVLLTRRLHRAL